MWLWHAMATPMYCGEKAKQGSFLAQFRPTLAVKDPCSVLSDGRRDDVCMMLA